MDKTFSADYNSNIMMLDRDLRLSASFDMVGREIKIDKIGNNVSNRII